MQKINLDQKFGLISAYWSPKIAGELNDHYIKLAKLKGEFIWHQHDQEDELFLVVKGQLRMLFRNQEITLNEGEFLIVPRGVEHKPVAVEEACVVLLEPKSTLNTGNVRDDHTIAHVDWI